MSLVSLSLKAVNFPKCYPSIYSYHHSYPLFANYAHSNQNQSILIYITISWSRNSSYLSNAANAIVIEKIQVYSRPGMGMVLG